MRIVGERLSEMKLLPFLTGLSQGQYIMTNPRKTLEDQIAEAEAKVRSRFLFKV